MANLPHNEYHPLFNSSLNVFNPEVVDVSVKHGYYEQFCPQQPLSENMHFQICSSEGYFIDLNSTFIDLHLIVQKTTNEEPRVTVGISCENCVLHNLFRQISVYIIGTLVSTINNLLNYTSYIQFILVILMSYKLLRGMAIGY